MRSVMSCCAPWMRTTSVRSAPAPQRADPHLAPVA
jgi:hypothetical protein